MTSCIFILLYFRKKEKKINMLTKERAVYICCNWSGNGKWHFSEMFHNINIYKWLKSTRCSSWTNDQLPVLVKYILKNNPLNTDLHKMTSHNPITDMFSIAAHSVVLYFLCKMLKHYNTTKLATHQIHPGADKEQIGSRFFIDFRTIWSCWENVY